MKNGLVSNLWFLQVKGCWLVGGTPYWGSPRRTSLTLNEDRSAASKVQFTWNITQTAEWATASWYFLKCQKANIFFPWRTLQIPCLLGHCSQQSSVSIFLYSNGYTLFSKNTFYRNQILPLHTPENQYFNPLIEEVILEMPPPYHLPRDKESL